MDLNKGMKYKRALIPFGLASLVSPVVFVELRNVMWVAVLYFLGSFCLLINFPSLSITLHSKPLYVEDLIDERNDDRFKMVYEVLMIFLMSTMIAGFAEYIFLRNLSDRSPGRNCSNIRWKSYDLFENAEHYRTNNVESMCVSEK